MPDDKKFTKKRAPSKMDQHWHDRALHAVSMISMLHEEIEGYLQEIRSKDLKKDIEQRLGEI